MREYGKSTKTNDMVIRAIEKYNGNELDSKSNSGLDIIEIGFRPFKLSQVFQNISVKATNFHNQETVLSPSTLTTDAVRETSK